VLAGALAQLAGDVVPCVVGDGAAVGVTEQAVQVPVLLAVGDGHVARPQPVCVPAALVAQDVVLRGQDVRGRQSGEVCCARG
jgi:hypothetical protein